LPWSPSFNYNLAPRNIVLKVAKSCIKSFRPGKVTGTIWPVCPTCGKSLEMFHRDEQIRREHWSCPERGEFEGVGMKVTREILKAHFLRRRMELIAGIAMKSDP
jgi:hypothetical protein